MKFLSRLLFFLSLFCWLNLHAQELFFRQVYENHTASHIEVTGLFSKLPTSGYAPVRVTISNRMIVPATFTLSFRSTSKAFYRNDDVQVKSSFTLSCPASQVRSTDLMVPVAALVKKSSYAYDAPLSLQVNLYGMTEATHQQSSDGSGDFPQMLMSESLYTPNASALDGELNKHSGSGRSHLGAATFAGKFEPKQMPSDWRAYVGYDRILLTSDDWQQMPQGARAAMLQWNRQGGCLHLLSSRADESLPSLGIDVDDPKLSYRGLGPVLLEPINSDLKLNPTEWVTKMKKSVSERTPRAEMLQNDYSKGTWEMTSAMGRKTFYFAMFIILLVIFGILVGPINLFVFAKSGQRHKLFITTPLISLGASLLMIILIFAQDGVGGAGVRMQWIHLVHEKGDHHAYVHQEQLSRTGVLMGSRFVIEEPCAITPLALDASQWTRLSTVEGPMQSFELEQSEGTLRAAGDWFQSRSEQAQLLQTIRPSRSRIEYTDAAKSPKLMSNLDHSLRHFFLRDAQGQLWQAHDIAPGKAFTLQPCTDADWRKFLQSDIAAISHAQKERIKKISERADHFISISEDAPMIETSTSIDWKENKTILTGKVQATSSL
ncbi:MAG: hypothetical protein EAZ81_03575 [Verrucomicrobia bacterium]|nr:MAG: hypothetical protein EAZ81_03575 [Verrucomicrobiota bacterium]